MTIMHDALEAAGIPVEPGDDEVAVVKDVIRHWDEHQEAVGIIAELGALPRLDADDLKAIGSIAAQLEHPPFFTS